MERVSMKNRNRTNACAANLGALILHGNQTSSS